MEEEEEEEEEEIDEATTVVGLGFLGRWRSLRGFVGGGVMVVRQRKGFGVVRLAERVAVVVRAISECSFWRSVFSQRLMVDIIRRFSVVSVHLFYEGASIKCFFIRTP